MKKMLLLFVCWAFTQTYLHATSLNTRIDIGENAINLFLSEQYNNIDFPTNFSGTFQDINYNITLLLPYIKLLDGKAQVYLGFKVESDIYNGIIEVSQDILFSIDSTRGINSYAIEDHHQNTSPTIRGNVHLINIPIEIDKRISTIIRMKWNLLNLKIYPLKLANLANDSKWLVERAISIVSPYFDGNFECIKGKLRVTLISYVEANEYYLLKVFSDNGKPCIKFSSGSQVNVKEIRIYSIGGSLISKNTNLGTCPKKGEILISCPSLYGITPGTSLIIKVVLENSDTFYVRNYKCIFGLPYFDSSGKIN